MEGRKRKAEAGREVGRGRGREARKSKGREERANDVSRGPRKCWIRIDREELTTETMQ